MNPDDEPGSNNGLSSRTRADASTLTPPTPCESMRTMASELAIREKLDSLKARLRGIHAKAEGAAGKMQRKLAAGAIAYYYGTREVAASRPGAAALPTVAGLRPSVAWALATFAVGEYAGGRIAEIADGASDGMIGVAAYNMGRESASRTRTTPGGPGAPPGP